MAIQNSAFVPPSPGAWELEQTHVTRPVSFYMAEVWFDDMKRGFQDGSRAYGVLLDYMEPAVINRFAYIASRPVGAPKSAKGPPPRLLFSVIQRLHPEIRRRLRRTEEVFRTRAWRDDIRKWEQEVKPSILAEARALLAEDLTRASDDDLIVHLRRATAFARQTTYWHHRYNMPVMIPLGDFLVHTIAWTGMAAGEVLSALRGLSPVSAGAVAELHAVRQAVKADPDARSVLLSDRAPTAIIDALQARPTPVAKAVRAYLDEVGLRIMGGYDPADGHAREHPELLVKIMRTAITTDDAARHAQAEQAVARVRERVPAEHRTQFDELLAEAQLTYGIRDERIFYGDGLGMGVARRAVLAVGERLAARGQIEDATQLIDATSDEMIALLQRRGGPSGSELAERVRFRLETPLSAAPTNLGFPPSPPPPSEWFSGAGARMQRIVELVLTLMFAPHSGSRDKVQEPTAGKTLKGFGVSPGVYEGPARVIRTIQELPDIQPGEVLVTPSTGPTFNVILPLIGALVTERGGVLSHAAIVAREYGLPGIVGCPGATAAIRTGMRIKVDGGSGEVWIPG
jgi:rifampicin phosphotransferase